MALLVAQFIFAWTMPHIGRNTPVTTLISLHFTFGIIILVVAIIRLAWRATHAEPAPLDGVPPGKCRARASCTGCSMCCFCVADPRMDQRFMARHADCDVWAGIAEIGRHARAGLGLDRRCAWLLANYVMLTLVGLHVAGRALSLFHPPRRRIAADAAGTLTSIGFTHRLLLPAFPGARKSVPFAFLDFARFLWVHVGNWRSHAHRLGLEACVESKKNRAAYHALARTALS